MYLQYNGQWSKSCKKLNVHILWRQARVPWFCFDSCLLAKIKQVVSEESLSLNLFITAKISNPLVGVLVLATTAKLVIPQSCQETQRRAWSEPNPVVFATLRTMLHRSAKGCRNMYQISSGTNEAQCLTALWLVIELWSVYSDFHPIEMLYDSVNLISLWLLCYADSFFL